MSMRTRSFDFYKNRYRFFAISMAFIALGVVMMLVYGLKLDIQFRGGSMLNYSYTGEVDEEGVRDLAAQHLNATVSVQTTKALSTEKGSGQRQTIVVNVAGDAAVSEDEQSALRQALAERYPEQNIEVGEVVVVEPFIGREMLRNALLAVLIAAVLIVAYVWIRFRSISGPSAGVFALLALLHDVLIAFFSFVIFRFSLNESLLAVILSILGWSVNDTIVIYDRIRENAQKNNGERTLAELVNLSIHQSLSRSVITSACCFLAIIVAYVFAAAYNITSIKEFTLPMAIGLFAGTYSSIFLATPFWAMWKMRKDAKATI